MSSSFNGSLTTMFIDWSFLTICFIIAIVMGVFFQRAWWFFGLVGITLLIEGFRICQEPIIWLIVAGGSCIIIAIPLVFKDYKESKIQALKNEIHYKTQVVFEASYNEERELARLEQMNIWSMVISWFRKEKST